MDEKAQAVQSMFAGIARRYDLVNDLISVGQHRLWKARAINLAQPPRAGSALDLCTGTGDLALALRERVGPGGSVVGADFCAPMLEIARDRAGRSDKSPAAPIEFIEARAEELPLASSQFDCVTVAFGLRNVSDIPAALREALRVLKPGGRLVSLDCSTPESALFGAVFGLYFNRVVPLIGAVVNGSRSAYTYLPSSVASFPQKREMCSRMREAGFASARFYQLSGGSAAIHVAEKAEGAGIACPPDA